MKLRLIILILIVSTVLTSCSERKQNDKDITEVDFSESFSSESNITASDTLPIINVAVSAMISPGETFSHYSELFEYISEKINHKINFKQRKTYLEVNQMLRKNEIDMAFICSGAYVEEKEISEIEIIAVPICNGKPMYQAYIIANKQSIIETFNDFQGKSFAFTDPLSNTGRLYAIKRLNDISTTPEVFFSSTIYTHAHDISMQLVSKNVVDGATIDGLIYDYNARISPELVKNLKIIEKSEYFGIPPIVVPSGLDENLKSELKKIFLAMHLDTNGKKIIDQLLIEKFIEGDDNSYNEIRRIKRVLEQ